MANLQKSDFEDIPMYLQEGSREGGSPYFHKKVISKTEVSDISNFAMINVVKLCKLKSDTLRYQGLPIWVNI